MHSHQQTPTLPSRTICTSSPVHPEPYISIQNKKLTHLQNPNTTQTPIQHRPFSQTLLLANAPPKSPFRLSSTQPSITPAPDPETQSSPFPDPETHTYIDPNTGLPVKDYSRWPPKRQWPPDMSKLSPKHQFRLERKYRRRAALKYERPKWTKATILVQWGAIGFVVIYALLFMQWDERGGKPIEELRTYIFGTLKGAFSAPPSPTSMRRPEESAKPE
ncbi:hypothetical protein BDW74DRAFT_174849 [Aspergillus multicolor]|uniref:uncharacterized protein n=1 Tax=Aspergillus multicolor TaxID=41759 RepID=UPI003CCD085F